MVKSRPVYLNLFAIRQPLPAIVSILHRASGALLFLLGIPAILTVLEQSLRGPEAFDAMRTWFVSPLSKVVWLLLIWAYLHHFCAGIRYLLIDVHVGDDLRGARQSSALVLLISLALTVVVGVRLW